MTPLLLLLIAQATGIATPPLLPDYAHVERAAQAEARTIALHRRMDADGDGYVTQTEMARYTAELLKGATIPGTDATHPLPARSIAYFNAADTDHDGRISLAEAVASVRREFDLQDSNHDGVVTPAERMAFLTTIMKDGKTPEGVPILPPEHRAGAMPTAWYPPAQARWTGDAPPIRVMLQAGAASMRGDALLTVRLLATGDDVAVSPFLQATRGIGFDVTTITGQPVAPAEPMIGSPPPPPLAADQLTTIGRASPLRVDIHEKARMIFPAPGLYRISATVTLFDPDHIPARRTVAVSAPVTIKVTE
jgi:Ca2+-binding EF-hand superfamily protein